LGSVSCAEPAADNAATLSGSERCTDNHADARAVATSYERRYLQLTPAISIACHARADDSHADDSDDSNADRHVGLQPRCIHRPAIDHPSFLRMSSPCACIDVSILRHMCFLQHRHHRRRHRRLRLAPRKWLLHMLRVPRARLRPTCWRTTRKSNRSRQYETGRFACCLTGRFMAKQKAGWSQP
jgi:hypothetical protein